MVERNCDCCRKNGIKTGNLKSTLSDKKFKYCLICGAIHAEPKHLVDEIKKTLDKTPFVLEEDIPLVYYDEDSDTYIDIRKGIVSFPFKDNVVLYKRSDIIEKLKTQDNADDIFKG